MNEIDAVAFSPAQSVLAADVFGWDGHGLETGIGIAASGGGFRAMLFHVGAFIRLNELGLLARAKRISSVSGGSIATGWLACVWAELQAANFENLREVYVAPMLAFARSKLDVLAGLTGLLPGSSAARQLAACYDKHLFAGRTLQDLPDAPQFVFCATNLQTGVLWRFAKAYAGDYLVGRLDRPTLRLATAVAASSAFPPMLSPLTLPLPEGSFGDWPLRPGERLPPPLSAAFRQSIVLSDGGVYDNHGIEPIIKRFATAFVSDGGQPFTRNPAVRHDWFRQLRRILSVTDNQVRALRRRDLIDRFKAGGKIEDEDILVERQEYGRWGAYWGIDTDPNKSTPPDALPCDIETVHRLAKVGTRLSDPGDDVSKQLINWGYAIADRNIRTHYHGPMTPTRATWPCPDATLG